MTNEEPDALKRGMLESEEKETAYKPTMFRGLSVVAIDDDEFMCDIISRLLHKLGFAAVHMALNGPDGLELAQTVRPDIIICDILMEPMDGFDFLAKLRLMRDFEETPVVFLSSEINVSIMLRAKDMGAEGVLIKPVPLYRMEERILKALKMV